MAIPVVELKNRAVEVYGISKQFGAQRRALPWRKPKAPKPALDGVSLQVERGGITGILGANGSGKSTLIRVLATLLTPDAGTATVFGYDVVREAGAVRRHINRVSVKVAIARSFLTSPSLLLMDEPTTGLDPRSKREVQDLVSSIRRDRAATVLLCTHDLQEAEVLCDHVIVIDRGRVLAQGTPAELIRRHAGREDGSLEDAFMQLTGKRLAEDEEEKEE
jgi:ABC-type multidrug transport system ATPase subunit